MHLNCSPIWVCLFAKHYGRVASSEQRAASKQVPRCGLQRQVVSRPRGGLQQRSYPGLIQPNVNVNTRNATSTMDSATRIFSA